MDMDSCNWRPWESLSVYVEILELNTTSSTYHRYHDFVKKASVDCRTSSFRHGLLTKQSVRYSCASSCPWLPPVLDAL